MKTWKIEIKMSVSENWVDDGFNPTDKEWIDYIDEQIKNMLPYAHENEVKISVTVSNGRQT